MKTKINLYIVFALLSLVSVSCSENFLEDKKSYGQYDDSFFQSQERVEWYINNMYYDYFFAYKGPTGALVGSYTDTYTKMTEELGGTQDLINPTKSFVNALDASGYFGTKPSTSMKNEPYSRIRECNEILGDLDIKGANLDKTFRDQIKGQVYYLRALQYYDLVRVYGGVPIVLTVQDASADDPTIKIPRAKTSEVFAQIVSDLDMAASLLPGTWPNAAANYGRFTKGAALAQKSRVLLTFASPLYNKNWDSSNERWNAALQAGLAAEAQLTADGYGLYGTTAKEWASMYSTFDNKFCKEAIVVNMMSTLTTGNFMSNGWEKGIRMVSQGGTSALEAPKEMIDLFPLADGRRPTAANGYNDFTFFLNRDPRFYRTFAFSGMTWPYKESGTATYKPVVWSYRWVDTANKAYFSDNNQENSPAYVRKMSDIAASNASNFQYSGTDLYEYRYAELLLNIAECYAALGQTSNTIAYLGKIRARVGIPSANNYGIGTLADKYAAIEACLYERRVELAYEGKRYWDIQRWMLYDNASLPGVSGGTVAKLGLTPINGTQRTGNFLQYKNTTSGSADPLASTRGAISVDPDAAAATFQTQLTALAAYYNANFVRTPLLTPLDNVNGQAVTIKFNPNYYIQGFNLATLTQNTWLPQTLGWNDASGGAGAYNFQD
ncbi:RagB/SusD family nutrient uptake outer membrane protein [Flavobacterium aquiphilum]|uniref:RagB/SusD family nutrient uptake outer membrane protein n=1 Tax=Flavobacterium aquiphilum TaxID=3003261 RepID=UPI0024818053|nr:RagB/SusD family nutrient uptake outer membrane protein [Flavobacterium aquiphilum]